MNLKQIKKHDRTVAILTGSILYLGEILSFDKEYICIKNVFTTKTLEDIPTENHSSLEGIESVIIYRHDILALYLLEDY